MADKIQTIRGMNDVLPEEAHLWRFFEDAARSVFEQYGYRYIRTPIVERTELFARGVGEATDIVEKEMYSFTDAMNGDRLSLRPESTTCSTTARSGCGTPVRCSATSGRRRAATASTIRSGLKRWAFPTPTSTSNCC